MATKLYAPSKLIAKDRACVWHPFTQMQTARPPIPIVRGKGVYLYAEDGTSYIDAISSWWVNLHGHAHPYIAEKINAQMEVLEQVIFAGFTHGPAVELAAKLVEILPGNMSKIFYSDNGSTAVEAAIKMAIQYWYNLGQKRTKIVCLKHSYHGDTFGAMAAAGRNEFNKPFWSHLFHVENIDAPTPGKEELSLKQLQAILENESVACFIFEPLILGAGGMIIYPTDGLDRLLQCCKRHQVITIADEVMTGFGRTGTLFACNQVKQSVDIFCFSKGLTGGYLPLGVTACVERIYNAFLSDHFQKAFLHGHSYTANPLACTSALASIDLLLEDRCRHDRERIAMSHRNFCRKWQGHPRLKRCESLGTILAIEYLSETSSYFDRLRDRLYAFFISKGILIRPFGNVVHVLPPYCIQNDELEYIYDQLALTFEGNI